MVILLLLCSSNTAYPAHIFSYFGCCALLLPSAKLIGYHTTVSGQVYHRQPSSLVMIVLSLCSSITTNRLVFIKLMLLCSCIIANRAHCKHTYIAANETQSYYICAIISPPTKLSCCHTIFLLLIYFTRIIAS